MTADGYTQVNGQSPSVNQKPAAGPVDEPWTRGQHPPMVQDNPLHHPSDAPDVIDLKTGAGCHLPQRLLPTSQGHPLSDQGVKLRISQLRGDCGCLMPRRAVPIRNRPETSGEQGEMRLKRRGNFAGVARRQTRGAGRNPPRLHPARPEKPQEQAGARKRTCGRRRSSALFAPPAARQPVIEITLPSKSARSRRATVPVADEPASTVRMNRRMETLRQKSDPMAVGVNASEFLDSAGAGGAPSRRHSALERRRAPRLPQTTAMAPRREQFGWQQQSGQSLKTPRAMTPAYRNLPSHRTGEAILRLCQPGFTPPPAQGGTRGDQR